MPRRVDNKDQCPLCGLNINGSDFRDASNKVKKHMREAHRDDIIARVAAERFNLIEDIYWEIIC